MRVLLTNHHLHERAGSELYVSELAGALRDRGHDVRLFTLLPGAIAAQLKQSGFEVYTPADYAAVESFSPEVAHVHHAPCLWWAGAVSLSCPVIFSSLGVIPPHEAAPAAWPGVALGVAVSEEVRTRLEAAPFGKAIELQVMRNWFDDRGFKATKARAPKTIQRVAVVTNHLHPTLAQHLTALGLEWTHFGLPSNPVEMTPELLKPFDAVVCIGRTVLLAGALGKPVVLYDVHGCDGVLDAERIGELASVNFSGRLTRHQPSLDELRAMFEACTKVDVAAVQKVLKKDFGLTARAAEWEGLYERALASGIKLEEADHEVYRPVFDLYWGELQNARIHLPHELHRLNGEIAAQRQRAEAAEHQLAELQKKNDELEARAHQARTYSQELEEDVAQLQQQLAEAVSKLDAPGAEDALRLADKANELRSSLLPEGTRRLAAFRTALHWARKKTR